MLLSDFQDFARLEAETKTAKATAQKGYIVGVGRVLAQGVGPCRA